MSWAHIHIIATAYNCNMPFSFCEAGNLNGRRCDRMYIEDLHYFEEECVARIEAVKSRPKIPD
jgi:hypothetical protein